MMLGSRRLLRNLGLLAGALGALGIAAASSCTLLIETRGSQCSVDADCAKFPHAACDKTTHVCVDQACAAGGCVCAPETSTEILNACPLGDCQPFDNEKRVPGLADGGLPDPGGGGTGGSPDPTYSCGTGGASSGTGGSGGAGMVQVCEELPSPLYIIGPGSIKPLLVWAAELFAKDGTTVVYQDDSSCIGIQKTYDTSQGMENDAGNEAWTSYFDSKGLEHPCKFVKGNIRPHIGLSDVFPQSCGYDTAGTDQSVTDTPGPVQAFGFIVPKTSTERTISAEAAYMVYGFGGPKGVAPWDDVAYVFQRSPDSGTQQMIATTLGLDATRFQASTSISSDDEASLVGCSPKPNGTLGILAADLVESGEYPIRLLAYQHYKQTCGYLPDSTETANDKLHVRDGHYFIWGPIHMLTRKDTATQDASALLNYVSGIEPPPTDEPLDIFKIWANAHIVPQCAMHVTRSSDGGPLSAYHPSHPCSCRYDEATLGSSDCPKCKTTTDCPAERPVCSLGYCEPQ